MCDILHAFTRPLQNISSFPCQTVILALGQYPQQDGGTGIDRYGAASLRFVGVWVVGLGGAGTVSHMGGHSWLPMWLVGLVLSCSPSAPVSGTGTGFGPLPSRERGIPPHRRPVDTALKRVRACATVVSSRYSAWRVTAPLDCGSSPQ